MASARSIWKETRGLILTAVAIIVILGALVVYSGIWPPLVVVESKSMQHSDTTSKLGVIDTGDIVVVQKFDNQDDLVTYVEGYSSDHRSFGDYGDVVIYKRDGSDVYTEVIHRAIILLVWNSTSASFDVPSLADFPSDHWSHDGVQDGQWWDLTGDLTIYHVGYKDQEVIIPLSEYLSTGRGGLITKGDNNDDIDQNAYGALSSPVQDDWIVSVAKGELPWFGLVKLWANGQVSPYDGYAPDNSWTDLFEAIVLIIAIPIAIDVGDYLLKRRGIDVWARIKAKMPWRKKDEEK